MNRQVRVTLWALAALTFVAASAAITPQGLGRFDALVIHDPSTQVGVAAENPDQIQGFDAGRTGWSAFRSANGASWSVWIDRRSGTPTLVQGAGLRWIAPGQTATAAILESKAREFVTTNTTLFGVRNNELVFDADGSGATDSDRWVLLFGRVVGGVPVEGERFKLFVNGGSLVAFGADRWGAIPSVPQARFDVNAAWASLYAYMGLTAQDSIQRVESGHLVFVPAPPAQDASPRFAGVPGQGIDHRLAWRFSVAVEGEDGLWVGKVDALTGRVIAFYDETMYAGVKGGVYPISNDQNCADFGCEIAGYPMPYADVTVGKRKVSTADMGVFTCPTKGQKTSSVRLAGPYVTTQDSCGLATVSGQCGNGLDFGAGAGTDCAVPAGQGSGDTHAGRSTYYSLNRIKEKARYWLPANTWVNQVLTNKPNVAGSCNAFWNGSVNFYKSGGGCRNAGEIAGVVTHEYGHGLDQNDGGGYDNPSEGYADVISILNEQRSCVGRGFFQSGNCSGYGDSCLNCSGIRDHDWDQRIRHTPATPQNFTLVNCGGGGGPCGREVHCEAYVVAESIFDLAARDLPAAGLDSASAWQLAEKLFYKSRQGSGGNAFNCAGGASDGCSSGSWFNDLRNADDDDGNLANGTPHAAAIFAAFSRHNIACGTAADASNLDSSSCPSLAAPAVTVSSAAGSVTLSWSAVAGASKYLVLRNDVSCGHSSNVISTVSGTSYADTDLPSGFPVYYRVQAQGSNTACDGAVSACVPASAQ